MWALSLGGNDLDLQGQWEISLGWEIFGKIITAGKRTQSAALVDQCHHSGQPLPCFDVAVEASGKLPSGEFLNPTMGFASGSTRQKAELSHGHGGWGGQGTWWWMAKGTRQPDCPPMVIHQDPLCIELYNLVKATSSKCLPRHHWLRENENPLLVF